MNLILAPWGPNVSEGDSINPTTGATGRGAVEEHLAKEVTRSGPSSGDNSPLQLNQTLDPVRSKKKISGYSRIG